MERKYKIILWDIFDNADQYLDTLFNEDTVELCEIFTSDDKGVNINTLPYFDEDCWDYLVIPFTGNNEKLADSIVNLISLLKIPGNKVICLDDNSLKLHADVAVKIFTGNAKKEPIISGILQVII